MSRAAAALLAAGCMLVSPVPALAGPAPAGAPGSTAALPKRAAGVPTAPGQLLLPPSQERPPPGHVRTAREVVALADRQPRVVAALRRHRGASGVAYEKGTSQWQVSYFSPQRPGQSPSDRKEVAQVLIDDRTGKVLESWTGFQVAWTMARGYPGAFGRKAAALYVWLPLALLFAVPFVDPRRPLSLRHLDLLALLGFSVSLAFFSHADIGVSVPLAYPPLLYLLARMLALARRRARVGPDADPPARSLRLLVPASWLAVALVFLVGFRVGLNVVNSNVIDVGYAGVIGANHLVHGERVYGGFPNDNEHGDTYGPVVYYAYVPFERVWPWSGSWDDLPAAHAASVFFDLLTMLLLWLLGRRVRGPTLGVALAYAWAAYPFTLFAASSNSNDSLVAALVVAMLLAARSPVGRGVTSALAALTKFAPLALAPVMALHGVRGQPDRRRRLVVFAIAFAATALVVLAPVAIGSGLGVLYDRTVDYQATRSSPFSVWGLVGGLGTAQAVVQVAALALAVLVAIVPRRRDVISLAALAAAVLIATQLGVSHWFYLYIVWFLPAVLLALLGEGLEPPWRAAAATSPPARAAGPLRSPRRASAVTR